MLPSFSPPHRPMAAGNAPPPPVPFSYIRRAPTAASRNSTPRSAPRPPTNAPIPRPGVLPERQPSSTTISTTTDYTKRPATVPQKVQGTTKVPKSKQKTPRVTPPKGSKTPRTTRPTLSVVLPPRNMSVSSTTLIESDTQQSTERESFMPPIKITMLHFQNSYSPHKAHWIKSALENLGTSWIRNGKTTFEQLMSEEFEEKMGVFYDLAMAKKHEAIDRLVGEYEQETGKPRTKLKKGSARKKPVEIHPNFPFAEHLSSNVKSSMSDALLRIMTREDGKGDSALATAGAAGAGSGGRTKKEDESTCSNSFERELKKRKSLMQCYVIDGGKLVIGTKKGLLGVGGSFVNQFADPKVSRVRRAGGVVVGSSRQSLNNLGFYRRSVNMMGFLPHEVKIRFCRTSRQLVVNGARPQRAQDNARQVREVIEVPKQVDVRNLKVLRTMKGSLIFEEAADDSDDKSPPPPPPPSGKK